MKIGQNAATLGGIVHKPFNFEESAVQLVKIGQKRRFKDASLEVGVQKWVKIHQKAPFALGGPWSSEKRPKCGHNIAYFVQSSHLTKCENTVVKKGL